MAQAIRPGRIPRLEAAPWAGSQTMTHDDGMQWLDEALSASDVGERLERQLRFVIELDKAKSVYRRTYITHGSRLENDAEHMWHVLIAGLLLAEHANEQVDPIRLALMLGIHDIVEIDAGDAFIYDEKARRDKVALEAAAAERLFGILPPDQETEMRALWEEFEAKETATAKMAGAIDRLLPLLMNRALDGRSWLEHGITGDRVLAVNSQMADGSTALWGFGKAVLDKAIESGVLPMP
jgi:putative hydrolase of HD superfamily